MLMQQFESYDLALTIDFAGRDHGRMSDVSHDSSNQKIFVLRDGKLFFPCGIS